MRNNTSNTTNTTATLGRFDGLADTVRCLWCGLVIEHSGAETPCYCAACERPFWIEKKDPRYRSPFRAREMTADEILAQSSYWVRGVLSRVQGAPRWRKFRVPCS